VLDPLFYNRKPLFDQLCYFFEGLEKMYLIDKIELLMIKLSEILIYYIPQTPKRRNVY
jgi:hypothetical protein